MAYFGPGWDFDFIRNFGINRKGKKSVNKGLNYNKFSDFILIHALPKIPHYDPDQAGYNKSKNEEVFIETLKNEASKYGITLMRKTGNMLTFLSKNKDLKIQYYYNTTVEEALNDTIIRRK